MASKAPTRDPRSGRSVPRVVHQLFVEHQPDDYRKTDRALRITGVAGIVVGLAITLAGNAVTNLPLQITGLAVAVVTLGTCLFIASRRYKHAYRDFITQHMADDGTFLFCPNCRYDLSTQNQHRVCPACNTKPWVFKSQS